MIRKLLMTTAISLIATSGAMAAGTKDPATSAQPTMEEYLPDLGQAALASNLIGESVYTSESPDAEVIGDINDLVVGDDGTIEAVVIGVGGFLGVGEKNVAVNFDMIRWAEDGNGDQFAVFEASKESLQNAPEFTPEETAMAPAEEPMEETGETAAAPAEEPAAESEETAAAPAEEPVEEEEDTAMAPAEEPAEESETAMAPAAEPLGQSEEAATTEDQATGPALTDVDAGSVSAEQLIGATVYAADEESVGEISDVRLNAEGGEVDAIIIDVGGFLGIGAKPVAIAFESLTFRTDEAGNFYVYTDFTREELDAAPDYDEAAYDEQRDAMRLTATQ